MKGLLSPEEVERLARDLALLYPTPAETSVVAQHAAVENFGIHDKAITTWNSVINEAEKQGKTLRLIERAKRDYPEDLTLSNLHQDVVNRKEHRAEPRESHSTVDVIGRNRRFPFTKGGLIAFCCLVVGAVTLAIIVRQRPDTNPTITLSFDAHRDPLIYHVSLHDKPPAETQFIVNKNPEKYIFYTTYVNYKRTPPRGAANLLITAITNSSSYAQWVRTNDVLYREIIGVDAVDKSQFDALTRRIDEAATSRDKIAGLSGLIDIEFRVNGLLLELNDFHREPFGYVLSYKNPISNRNDPAATYEFKCRTFQPRTITNFPFIVSELSRHLDYKLDYSDVTVDTPEYFSAFLYNPISNLEVTNDALNKVLTVRSRGNEWVYPGGGIILYWK